MGLEVSVAPQQAEGGGEHREGQQDQEHRHQLVPAEDRHAEHDHAGCSEGEDGRDDVHGREDAGETGERDADDPHVGTWAGGVDGLGERGVAEPAEVGGTVVGEEAGAHDHEATEVQPVRQVVEAGERHVRRPDLQRDDVVGQTEGEGAQEDEEHDRAVHRQELVVDARLDEVVVGDDQLAAHHLGHEAGEEEADESRHHVVEADLLVIGARYELDQTGRAGPGHDLGELLLGEPSACGAFLDEGH
jgi:hypothetical protein